jgi:hypothetical protein
VEPLKRMAIPAESSAIVAASPLVTAAEAVCPIHESADDPDINNSCWKRRAEDADASAAALRPIHGVSSRAVLTRAAIRHAPGCDISSVNARLTTQAMCPTIAC